MEHQAGQYHFSYRRIDGAKKQMESNSKNNCNDEKGMPDGRFYADMLVRISGLFQGCNTDLRRDMGRSRPLAEI